MTRSYSKGDSGTGVEPPDEGALESCVALEGVNQVVKKPQQRALKHSIIPSSASAPRSLIWGERPRDFCEPIPAQAMKAEKGSSGEEKGSKLLRPELPTAPGAGIS